MTKEKQQDSGELLPAGAAGQENAAGMTRGEFLKVVGATGLGLAGMGAFMGMSSPALAADQEEGKKKKFLFVITAGSNDPNRAMLALLLADVVQKQEMGEVHIYLVLEGAELGKTDGADKIVSSNFHRLGNAQVVLERLARLGARIGICPPCADWAGVVGDKKFDFIEREDGGVLLRSMQESWTAWL